MFISDVLHGKGHRVETVRTTDSVEAAVCKLAEKRIGAVVVEDQWMRHAGVFSERDFVKAVAEHGARAMAFAVERLMTTPVAICPDERIATDVRVTTRGRSPAPGALRRLQWRRSAPSSGIDLTGLPMQTRRFAKAA